MAKIRMACAWGFFLLVLILCNEVVSVDGRRHLKRSNEAKKNSLKARAGGSERLRNGEKVVGTSKVEYVDDFRPTTPGHSPGVGHSVHN
ncbi:hypothetical protein CsSME_00003755 [Camellia sinensis var. sinensis]|uniref:Precursor of CEP3 n=1 Tax=Camellia lanceoleosa TaxID=1840588 RepID=A0ACC0J2K9_9ERIC|nr:Precursor of CEP3 [Camellia lanceoleosa]